MFHFTIPDVLWLTVQSVSKFDNDMRNQGVECVESREE